MELTGQQRQQLMHVLEEIGRAELQLLRAHARMVDLRRTASNMLWPVKNLDDIERGHGIPTCRHDRPAGEFCPFCAESPEG